MFFIIIGNIAFVLIEFLLEHVAAIATVVTIAEILKNNGFAVEKSEFLGYLVFIFLYDLATKLCFCMCIEIMTSTVDIKDGSRGRPVQKPKVVFMG